MVANTKGTQTKFIGTISITNHKTTYRKPASNRGASLYNCEWLFQPRSLNGQNNPTVHRL